MAAQTVQVQRLDPDGTIKLLSAILWRLPTLPGAACQGHHELFEDQPHEGPAAKAQRVAVAARLCRGCPQRVACTAR